ncbi:MAG: hypothetical protein ACRDBO_13500 [Lachnospiraceae bacterium]
MNRRWRVITASLLLYSLLLVLPFASRAANKSINSVSVQVKSELQPGSRGGMCFEKL